MNDIIIACEHLCVAYQDKLALENITFNIHHGQFWGILGPNGSGKTTLLRTMLGLIEPLSGTVSLFGRAPRQLGALRDKIGYVPQYAQID
ncbi:MAG TPA: ATP-binding cassette domain-containing protein, partial [bacterium]|nr:ATP-binding cassette domain-containing protein [bacterium]